MNRATIEEWEHGRDWLDRATECAVLTCTTLFVSGSGFLYTLF